ncbi:MAG TPA: Ig-like domain-containing protein [Gemmatimonadales bacterium]|nr:Ig-like domain-containing protein [Gemmatimonadales bacterium]
MLSGRAAAVAACVVAAACARIEPPPGGPPDRLAPTLASTRPDSMRILPDFDGTVDFVFNEVISEGGQPSEGRGTGDLERLVLLSPSDEVPVVQWKRNRIAVRPRDGWQPNRVYRVQLLPGVADVRNNRGAQSSVVTFTTGAPLPDFTLTGKAFDWNTSQPARGALLEAVLEPDSLVYKGATDSAGTFTLGPLPRGQYVVHAVIDQNRNLRRDRREAFDSVRVVGDSGLVPELWLFAHDTTPPKLQAPTPLDSMGVTLPFNQKLDPTLRLDSTAVTILRLPDSTRLGVRAVLPPAIDDSLQRLARQETMKRDSLARAAERQDSAPPAAPPPAAKPDSAKGRAKAAPPTPAPAQPAPAKPPVLRPVPDSGKAVMERLDSTLRGQAKADTNRAKKPSRPPLYDRLVLRLTEPLEPGGKYTVEVRGVRNVNGATGDSKAGFTMPEKPRVRTDTSTVKREKGDSTRPDSAFVEPRKQVPPKR